MSWSQRFLGARGMRHLCRQKILEEILYPMKSENEWKILIVDEFGMKLLTSCFKTEEVMACNIALIENLEKPRESIPYLEAIYLLYPSMQNIGCLQIDFVSTTRKYNNVHLFFLASVPDNLLNEILKYTSPGIVYTFKEIDIMFLPYESQVFSLTEDLFFKSYFDAFRDLDLNYCNFVAKKLTTFLSTIDCQPRIRYRRNFIKNFIFAEAVQKELSLLYKGHYSRSVERESETRSELLILDRGFDCITPIMHDFTLQAMSHDLLDIQDDVYHNLDATEADGVFPEISLTEHDTLWCKLRHQHIANVAKVIDGMLETSMLVRRFPTVSRFKKLPELGDIVRKQVVMKKNVAHILYRKMANECMKIYCGGINVLADLEQEMASTAISEYLEISDCWPSVMNIFVNVNYSLSDKLRILLLYIFCKRGISKPAFDTIIEESGLPFSEASIITNVLHLDIDIFKPEFCKSVDFILRQTADDTPTYKQSRWVPAIKNIILDCIDGRLSQERYPYIDSNEHDPFTASKRTGYWCSDKKDKHTSRLIIFVGGGVTYPEMRSVYEVMEKYKGWEVYIGGDSILTPELFLGKLKELKCFITKEQ